MNISNSKSFLQYNFMLKTGAGFSDPFGKISDQYRNRYADVNEVKVNSQGLTGMLFNFDSTDTSSHKQIIGISEEGKQKIFDMVKSEFMQEKGVHNGDTTHRTEVYTAYLKGIPEEDRAKASWTLDRLEAEYWSGFASEVKKTNPKWEPGKAFAPSAVQGLTKEDVSGAIDKQSSKWLDSHA